MKGCAMAPTVAVPAPRSELAAPARPSPSLDVRTAVAGRRTLARLSGPLAGAATASFLEGVRPLAGARRTLILDLRRVEFVDSDGIRALVLLADGLEATGGELRLVLDPDARVARTLRLLCLQDRFRTFRSALDAWIRRRTGRQQPTTPALLL